MTSALLTRLLGAARWTIAVAACFALTAQAAYAYLDPVSTTFIVQATAGFFAALIAGVRSFRRRLMGLFKTGRFVDPAPSPRAEPDGAVTAGDDSSGLKTDSRR